jgi:hypothetical protein
VAKRSPIRGYNHNVRHRGLIFHVQTEDSGVQNPHLFTHLFHGGVIISTRKLLYDNGSSEEVVKSLMQSQHKAALKELKAGTFDEKIDKYLAGTPGLEPAPRRGARDTLVTPPPPSELTADDPLDDLVTPPAGSSLSEAVLAKAVPAEPPHLGPTPRAGPTVPPHAQGATPRDAVSRSGGRPTGEDRYGGEPSRTSRSEVSNAFKAIAPDHQAIPSEVLDEGEETTPIPREMADLRSTQRGSPPPVPSDGVPQPRSSRQLTPSGAYSQHRRGRSDFLPEVHDQPTAPLPRNRAQASEQPPTAPVPPRPPPPRPPPIPAARAAGKSHAPSGPPPRAAGKSMSASAAAGSKPQPRPAVVVSRPAVIIGGPPKVVGTRDMEGPRPPARRAREEPSRPNLFGKDLISEKSLDEVILAYLSEDSSEE